MKKKFWWAALLLFTWSGQALAWKRKGATPVRRALVIAVSDYHGPWEHLDNPPHDLEDMTRKLQGLDFEVTSKLDPTKQEMVEAVHELVDDLRPGDLALFYFSGHGVQVNGENYLIPKGFDSEYEADVDDGTFHVKLLTDNLETREGVAGIVILDACRTDGLKRGRRGASERGLTPMADLPQGMIVAFASAANQPAQDGTGRNGVYTAALLRRLDSPGTRIDDLLRDVARDVYNTTDHAQWPAIYGTLLDPFCMKGRCSESDAPSQPAAPVEAPATAPEPLKIASESSAAAPANDGTTPPPGTADGSIKAIFRGAGWSLLDANQRVLCRLPCTRWVPRGGGWTLRFDAPTPTDIVNLNVPDHIDYTPGRTVQIAPHGAVLGGNDIGKGLSLALGLSAVFVMEFIGAYETAGLFNQTCPSGYVANADNSTYITCDSTNGYWITDPTHHPNLQVGLPLILGGAAILATTLSLAFLARDAGIDVSLADQP